MMRGCLAGVMGRRRGKRKSEKGEASTPPISMSHDVGGDQHPDDHDPSLLGWKSSAEERLLISSLDLEMEVELARDQSEGPQTQTTPADSEGIPVERGHWTRGKDNDIEGASAGRFLIQARPKDENHTDSDETQPPLFTKEISERDQNPLFGEGEEDKGDVHLAGGGGLIWAETGENLCQNQTGARRDHDAASERECGEGTGGPRGGNNPIPHAERGEPEAEPEPEPKPEDEEAQAEHLPTILRVPTFPLVDSEDLPIDHSDAGLPRKKLFDLSRFEKRKQADPPSGSRSLLAGKRMSSAESFDADDIPIRIKDKEPMKHKEPRKQQQPDHRSKELPPDPPQGDKFRGDLEKMKERAEAFLGMDLDRELRSASQEDFQSPPRPKKPKSERFNEEKDEEDSAAKEQKCTICLERYNNGSHRAVNLKCGHVFAKSCIEKWLTNPKAQRCPNCNARAQKRDIRLVIPLVLVADDTMEREKARTELLEETRKVNEGRLEASKWKSQYTKAKADAEKLREQVELLIREKYDLSAEIEHIMRLHRSVAESQKRFAPWNSQVVSKEKNAKLLAYDKTHELLVVSKTLSQMSGTEKPSGFAKVSLLDPRNMPFVRVHSQPVKDIKCSPRSDTLVLSTSLDKTLKITNLLSGAVCHTFHLDQPGWSCSWDPVDPNSMIVGLQNNVVLFFDIRKTSTFVRKFDSTRHCSKPLPIHSLTAIRGNSEGANTFPRGILVGTPENAFFWSHRNGAFEMTSLENENVPGRNSCSFADFDLSSQKFLVSYRSDETRALPRYLVGSINEEGKLIYEQMVEGASQQKGMARSVLFSCPSTGHPGPKHQASIPLGGTETSTALAQVRPQLQSESTKKCVADNMDQSPPKLFLAAGDAGSSSLSLWDLMNAGASPSKLETKQKQIVDAKAFFAKEAFLGALSEDELFLFSYK